MLTLPLTRWAALAAEKRLVIDTAVSAEAAVVGSGAVDFHVSLSAMDVRDMDSRTL